MAGPLELIEVSQTDSYGFGLGVRPLYVHAKGSCAGEFCSIHNPSDHPLKHAPLHWRADKKIMERICMHGVGHDDPDAVDYMYRVNPQRAEKEGVGVHGCDGCCRD